MLLQIGSAKVKGLPAMEAAIRVGAPVIQNPEFWKKHARLQAQAHPKPALVRKTGGK